MSSFSFGGAQQQSSSGFSFGGASSQAQNTGGFSFGAASSQAQNTGGFSFGAASSQAQNPGGFSFGAASSQAQNAGGFSFGASSQAQSTGGFSFGGSTAQPQSSSGFSFGGASAAPQAQNTGGFSFGGASSQAQSTGGFSFGAASSQAQSTGGFSFGASASQPQSSGGFSFGASASQPQSSGGFSFGASSQAQTGGFSFGGSQPQSSSGFGFGQQSTTNPQNQGVSSQFFTLQQSTLPNANFGGDFSMRTMLIDLWPEFATLETAFQTYVYDCVVAAGATNTLNASMRPQDQLTKPAHVSQRVWEDACKNNPQPQRLIPSFGQGVEFLKQRKDAQEKAIDESERAIAALQTQSTELLQWCQKSVSRVDRIQAKDRELKARLIHLYGRLATLQRRALPLADYERQLRARLDELQNAMDAPSGLRGRLHELRPRLLHRFDGGDNSQGGLSDTEVMRAAVLNFDAETIEKLFKILESQHTGISELVNLVNSDNRDVDTMAVSLRTGQYQPLPSASKTAK